jgi:Ca2+-binding RTX toxin-like protein
MGGDDAISVEFAGGLIDGGEGTDLLRFYDVISVQAPYDRVQREAGVHIDLELGLVIDDGYGNQSTVLNIENLRGTNQADVLIGDSGENVLTSELGDDVIEGGAGNDTISLSGGADTIVMSTGDDADTVSGFSVADQDRIDVSGFNLTAAEALALVQQNGADTFIDFGNGDSILLRDVTATDLTEANFIGGTTPPSSDFNDIIATGPRETLIGTSAADRFLFADGTSTTSDIDVVRDWQPGDIIDLSGTGLTLADLETRLISGGNTLKLIEGFGGDDFQLKIELGGYSVDDILASLVFDGTPPENRAPDAVNDTATAVLTDPVIIDALANDSDPDGDLIALVDFQQASNGAVTLNTDGTFTYTANADFTGADSFTYRIQDEDGAISEATVTVMVGDGTPTPYNDIVATDARETLIGTSAADRFVFADGTSTTGDIDVLRDWQPGDIIDLSDTGLTLDDLETRLISDGNTLKLIEGFGADDFQLKIELGGYSVEDVLASVVTGPQTTESFAENAFDFSGLQPASPVSVEEEYLAQSKPITPIAEVQFAWNDTEMWDANSFDLDHAFQMDDSGLWILA